MEIRKTVNDIAGKVPYLGDILTKEIKPRHALAGAVLALGLGYAAESNAANVRLEATYGSDRQGDKKAEVYTMDTLVSGKLSNHLKYSFRNRTEMDVDNPDPEKDNKVGGMSLINLGYLLDLPMPGKASVLGVVSFPPGGEAVPRIGLDYFIADKGFAGYIQGHRNLGDNPNTELFGWASWNPQTDGPVNPYVRVEGLTNIPDTGWKDGGFALGRVRVGVEKDGWAAGYSNDITGIGSGGEIDQKHGGFVQVNLK
ncbi:MAG: hypothetical protein KKE20_05480 [Nanoarchaeota archaeon]|nr:hypothetical protein [Nanoarchaeota archaeon]